MFETIAVQPSAGASLPATMLPSVAPQNSQTADIAGMAGIGTPLPETSAKPLISGSEMPSATEVIAGTRPPRSNIFC